MKDYILIILRISMCYCYNNDRIIKTCKKTTSLSSIDNSKKSKFNEVKKYFFLLLRILFL